MLGYRGFCLFANDGIVINSCNPQILWCVVCHYVIADDESRLFARGKNKGCVKYNKYYGIRCLKERVSNKHFEEYRK
jgi:hypothetical protein